MRFHPFDAQQSPDDLDAKEAQGQTELGKKIADELASAAASSARPKYTVIPTGGFGHFEGPF